MAVESHAKIRLLVAESFELVRMGLRLLFENHSNNPTESGYFFGKDYKKGHFSGYMPSIYQYVHLIKFSPN